MKNVFFVFCILLSLESMAVEIDSLVKFNDLSFNKDLDRNSFLTKLSGRSDEIINLFLTSYKEDSTVSYSEVVGKINDCVRELQEEIKDKSEQKKVKIIYDFVHKRFFKVYNLKNSFSEIFSKGEYNCVSASAMYAFVFERLNISYQLKETPNHIFLIAYPESHKIVLETTAPENGYYRFPKDFAQNFVQSLIRAKRISKQEMDTTTMESLFNKYYFSSEDISIVQLAALQYDNFGLFNIDEKKYEVASVLLRKAYYLYPSDRIKYNLYCSLLLNTGNNNYSKMSQVKDLELLCRYFNSKDEGLSSEILHQEFQRLAQSQLINNSDYTIFDSSFYIISGSIADSGLKNEITFEYHYELARLGFLNYKDSLYEVKHLTGAYNINSNNANLRTLILGYFGRVVEEQSNNPLFIIHFMNSYSKIFPFLDDNQNYNTIKANCLLEQSYRNFSLNDLSKGETFIASFEKLMLEKKEISINSSFVEKAYMTAAGVYFKKNNYTKSKQYVKSGLVYAPESFQLKRMLSQY